MEEFVSVGLIKSIGISNFNERQIQRILDNSTIRPACLQIELHVYFQQNELVDYCKNNNIAVVAYSPLGSRGIAELYKNSGNAYVYFNYNIYMNDIAHHSIRFICHASYYDSLHFITVS